MGKRLFYSLGLILTFATTLRADDVTVSDGLVDTFSNAVETVKGTGGGTITVTTPIVIADSTNGAADETFDGESLVTVSGGNTNSIFIVTSGSLTLSNMTLANGLARFGGAISNSDAGALTLFSCTFSNNHARGADGESAISDTNSSRNVAIGKNGQRGTAGESAIGGAIYSFGALTIGDCKFITNSAVGGTGGDGSDGESAGTRGGNGGAGGAGGSATGGAVFTVGTLVISNSTFSGNAATGGSGGIGGFGGGAIISGLNGAAGMAGIASGGGLYTASNNAVVLASTFDNNTVNGGGGQTGGTSGSGVGQNGPRGGDALGAGIDNSGTLDVENSTFYKNFANGGDGGDGGVGGVKGGNGGVGGSAIGGGIYNAGTITVVNCTFSKGSASGGTAGSAGSGALPGKNGKTGSSFGGNIANVAKKRNLGFTLANSILGIALSGNDAYGKINDQQYNLVADKSIKFKTSSTSKPNTNALAGGGDIANNGGLTQTIALTTNSPAVDFIKDPTIAPPSTDQRGDHRPFGDFSDAGAFELDPTQVTIPGQPQNVSVLVGSNATFTVGASGLGPLFYQWFFSNAPVAGATSPSLLITNAQFSNAGPYFVLVSNAFNSATSSPATLTVNQPTNFPPAITNEPPGTQSATVGDTVTIPVVVGGATPLVYQWFFKSSTATNFTSFLGATNPVLTIVSVQLTNQGSYFVNITNQFGSTNSTLSSLFVNPPSTNGNPGPPGGP